MPLEHLHLEHFRNIHTASLDFHPRWNLFYGKNGSGKTSFLEALYYISTTRSFRQARKEALIQHGQTRCMLRAEMCEQSGHSHSIGLERHLNKANRTQIDGSPLERISQLAALLPIKVITAQNYRLLTDGPGSRRQYLDWGMFHVKHQYLQTHRQYQKALMQRNSLLKARCPSTEMAYWDEQCLRHANALDVSRETYCHALLSQLQHRLNTLKHPALDGLSMTYARGWDPDQSLERCYAEQWAMDQRLGYTQSGPHRADLKLTIGGRAVATVLSQGQLKLLAYLLQLTQGEHLSQHNAKPLYYLIDDIGSDFDLENTQHVLEQFALIPASQLFITAIHRSQVQGVIGSDACCFQVNAGQIHHDTSTVFSA